MHPFRIRVRKVFPFDGSRLTSLKLLDTADDDDLRILRIDSSSKI